MVTFEVDATEFSPSELKGIYPRAGIRVEEGRALVDMNAADDVAKFADNVGTIVIEPKRKGEKYNKIVILDSES